MSERDYDAALLQAWRDGDGGAGRQLVERHIDAVARFFDNKVRQGSDDLTQATFLRMIEGRERLREDVAFRAYVLGIARNVLREHLRVLARGRQIDPTVDSMAELAPGPSTLFMHKQEQRLLLEGLRRLVLDDQIVLELYYWEGLETRDIAVIMGLLPSTLRWRLARARERLLELMTQITDSHEQLASTLDGLEGWANSLREQVELGPEDDALDIHSLEELDR